MEQFRVVRLDEERFQCPVCPEGHALELFRASGDEICELWCPDCGFAARFPLYLTVRSELRGPGWRGGTAPPIVDPMMRYMRGLWDYIMGVDQEEEER